MSSLIKSIFLKYICKNNSNLSKSIKSQVLRYVLILKFKENIRRYIVLGFRSNKKYYKRFF